MDGGGRQPPDPCFLFSGPNRAFSALWMGRDNMQHKKDKSVHHNLSCTPSLIKIVKRFPSSGWNSKKIRPRFLAYPTKNNNSSLHEHSTQNSQNADYPRPKPQRGHLLQTSFFQKNWSFNFLNSFNFMSTWNNLQVNISPLYNRFKVERIICKMQLQNYEQ